MYTGPLRLLRALGVSATCVALSMAAHLLGGGAGAPMVSVFSVVALLAATLLLTLVLTALSGRRWTLSRSLLALALSQVGLHALFTVLLSSHDVLPSSHDRHEPAAMAAMAGGASMTLAHGVAGLLIGVAIAVNDSALDTYFRLASSLVGSGAAVLSPWRLAALIPILESVAPVGVLGRGERFERCRRPRILTDLVLLQCLSRRGPPAFALAS
jgi:hypothetical protein